MLIPDWIHPCNKKAAVVPLLHITLPHPWTGDPRTWCNYEAHPWTISQLCPSCALAPTRQRQWQQPANAKAIRMLREVGVKKHKVGFYTINVHQNP